MLKFIFILPLLLGNPSVPNEDWGATGHRVVGEVAAQHISKKTAKAITRLLDGTSLAYVSNYADDIKSDDRYRAYGPWHYANLDLDETYSASEKNPEGDIVQAIEKCIAVLKNKKASKAERQFHLKLLVHFIGDLHQPMHLAKKEDRGGNEVSIKWFGKRSNLHRLWDSDMIDSSQLSYTELAQNLTVLSPAQKAQIVSGSLSVWVAEIHELTKKVYQELPENTNLGYRYRYQNFDSVRLQLHKAGLRLAHLLDEIFK